MKHLFGPVVLTLFFLLNSFSEVKAGAWAQAPGGSYLKLSFLHMEANERRDCAGQVGPADPSGRFRDRQLFLYGEYGLGDGWTVLGSWALRESSILGAEKWGSRGGSDLRLGARKSWGLGPRPFALQGALLIPTYPRSDLSREPAARREHLPAGSGQLGGEFEALGGWSLWPLPLYLGASAGLRMPGGSFATQWRSSLEVGGQAGPLQGRLGLQAHGPLSAHCSAEAVGSVALASSGLSLTPAIAFQPFANWGFELGLSFPLRVRNELSATQLSLGLVRIAAGG